MTKVEKIFEREKMEALDKLAKEINEKKDLEIVDLRNKLTKEKDEEKEKALKEYAKQIAKYFLLTGSNIIDIMKATGLTKDEIEELKK